MLMKLQKFLVEGFRKKDGANDPRSPFHQVLALVVLAVLCLGLFFWHQQSTKRAAEKAAQERQQRKPSAGPSRTFPRKTPSSPAGSRDSKGR